jgi:hypothetical protein
MTAARDEFEPFHVVVNPAASGDYTAQVHIGGVDLPVRLHVFDFAIPSELHVASQMNFSYQAILGKYSVPGTGDEYWTYVDAIKQFFVDHRLAPSRVLWPGGLTGGGAFAEPLIDYDCATHTFSDPYGIWGFEDLAQRYLAGDGLLAGQFSAPFNGGAGFSTFMAASFADNDPSHDQRPTVFCGQTRQPGDWLGATRSSAWLASPQPPSGTPPPPSSSPSPWQTSSSSRQSPTCTPTPPWPWSGRYNRDYA